MTTAKFWILFAGILLAANGQAPGDTLDPSKPLVDGETLASTRGIFELGFFRPGNSSNQYLGIWYKEIPDKPVVWVANTNTPINNSKGVLNLTANGNVLLLDKGANIFWSTNTSNATYPLLQLLDTGNLILTETASKKILWQSFDHPSNTFLPEMKIGLDFKTNLDRYLTSWRSTSDPTPGDYTYRMDPHGVPSVYIWEGSSQIFRTGPWDGKGWSGRPDMASNGVLQFEFFANDNEIYYTCKPFDKAVLGRAVLNESGVLQRLVWSPTRNEWIPYWAVPSDPCDQYATCGANGICTTSYSPICQCLDGFTPKSPNDWNLRDNSEGCVRKTPLNCSSDGFLPLENVKLPDTSNASAVSNMTLDECQNLCLKNCSCKACSIIRDSMCLIWTGDLVDVRAFTEGGSDLHIRLAASELDTVGSYSSRKISSAITIIIPLLSFLLLLCVASLLWLKRRNSGKVLNSYSFRSKGNDWELPLYDMLTIRDATNNFSKDNIVGMGGFGLVYKGKLGDGQEVAVKRLSKDSVQGIDEFKTEVVLIAKLQHRNLVRLLGCCIEDEERMLIYEYMQNKSLDNFIFDKRKSALLGWQKRLDIIIGIARGLLYLHQDSRLKIIHRDLKTSNILLDNDMNPKISDFGIARTFSVGQTEGSTRRVWKLWKESRCLELLAESSYPVFEALRCIQVGLLCVQEGSEDRPMMAEVVLMLCSDSIILPQPNRPGFYIARSCVEGNCFSNEFTITMLEGR
ncbi:hypothetical protein Cni_G23873 [Canna indica]|uniref:Receptor-like serine/threonine-protein kinase n=1 Tax=Canna indica TaxID=4628 RepID=A0AAQ3L134_9LILI|nr:hypothetical protein Cni_G23873 [Canna indica]